VNKQWSVDNQLIRKDAMLYISSKAWSSSSNGHGKDALYEGWHQWIEHHTVRNYKS